MLLLSVSVKKPRFSQVRTVFLSWSSTNFSNSKSSLFYRTRDSHCPTTATAGKFNECKVIWIAWIPLKIILGMGQARCHSWSQAEVWWQLETPPEHPSYRSAVQPDKRLPSTALLCLIHMFWPSSLLKITNGNTKKKQKTKKPKKPKPSLICKSCSGDQNCCI